jgi:hypothetical protein
MVAYATMAWIVSVMVVGMVYGLLWDIYVEFWNLALASGMNPNVGGVLYAVHQYLPAGFLISMTFWYLVQAQRKDNLQ